MLKIWGRANSINVQKVLWCCGELGLQYDRIDAGNEFGLTKSPEYRALNPNALVPTIEDGDFQLWESNVIVRYLAQKCQIAASARPTSLLGLTPNAGSTGRRPSFGRPCARYS